MGSDFSLDIQHCYPVVQHSPYWIICIGFITSTIIQLMTYISGHGMLSWIKSCIRCKCFRNKIYDLSKTNNWTNFPEIIQITSINPFKSNKEASRIYGTHLLHYDANDNTPYYKSRTPTSENQKFYELRYIKHELYTGWTLIVPNEQKYKFDMIQIDGLPDDKNIDSDKKPLEQTLLNDIERDIDDEKYGDIVLEALDRKRQKFRLFPKTKCILNENFWKNNVSKTNFEARQRGWDIKYGDKKKKKKLDEIVRIKQCDFKVNEQWINLKGFDKYIHNVWKNEVLDINGKYILKSIKDDTKKADSSTEDKDVSVIFNFVHSTNNALTLIYKMKYNGGKSKLKLTGRKITVKHNSLGDLVGINNTKAMIFNVYQYKYVKEMDILLRVESVSKTSYYRGEIITIILTLMILWQYIHDLIFFIRFVSLSDTEPTTSSWWSIGEIWPNEGVDNWTRYECYGYILTNSANMKQYIVFWLCWKCCGDSFLSRQYTFTGRIFLGLIIMHFVLLLPIFITHFLVFYILYIWILIIIVLIIGCIVILVEWISKKIKFPICDKSGYMILTALSIPTYILMILFPVITMSRYYTSNEYYDYTNSLTSVFTDRHTTDYVNDLTHKYYTIQQFFVWMF